jgi:hypothetical protein
MRNAAPGGIMTAGEADVDKSTREMAFPVSMSSSHGLSWASMAGLVTGWPMDASERRVASTINAARCRTARRIDRPV